MTDKQKLALRVNEIFHDIEGEKYQEKHEDIFSGEALRWQETAKKYFQDYKNPITILDIGTGTGFIPLNTAKYLSENDTFICSDISQEMLDVARKNIVKENFKCQFNFLKSDGSEINVNDNKVSIITINSVVHHIPNLEIFFSQLNKIVTPGGRIIIGHEPNKLFYKQKFLVNLYLLFQTFSSLKKFAITLARITRLNILLKTFIKPSASKIVLQINDALLKEDIIKKKLTKDEINKMVDYHSPSAGAKIDKTKGIDIEDIRHKYLSDFETEHFETYNFISKMSNKNALMKKINNSLSKKYKGKGATFFIVLKKKK